MVSTATMAPPDAELEPMTPKELRDQRRKLNLTQAGLAKHLEISLGRVRKYEQGERPIPPYFWRVLRDLERELADRPEPPADG